MTIQYLSETVSNLNDKKILIYGLGEIGKNTCKNVLEYTSNRNITLVNRTHEKALDFEQTHNNVCVGQLKI